MNCEEAHRLLDAYLDGELELRQQLELEEHLSICPSCQSHLQERQEFQNFFKANAPSFRAPAQLRAKILTTVRRAEAKPKFIFLRPVWLYAAAVAVLGIFLAVTLLTPDLGKELSRQAALRYSHWLAADRRVDVASTNPQAVKSWLTAKLAFPPPVVEIPNSGYTLIGGRVDVLQTRPVAVLVYQHENEVVTLFCWPPTKEQLLDANRLIKGVHVWTWSNKACNYILVSKIRDRQTDEFVDSFRDHLQSGAYY
jgi:anti-sigma factor RsiW